MNTQNNQSSQQINTAPFAPREAHHPDGLRSKTRTTQGADSMTLSFIKSYYVFIFAFVAFLGLQSSSLLIQFMAGAALLTISIGRTFIEGLCTPDY